MWRCSLRSAAAVLLGLALLCARASGQAASAVGSTPLAHRRSLLQPGPLVEVTNNCTQNFRVWAAFRIVDWTPGDATYTTFCTNPARAAATGTCVEELTRRLSPSNGAANENNNTAFVAPGEIVTSAAPQPLEGTGPLIRVQMEQANSSTIPGVVSNSYNECEACCRYGSWLAEGALKASACSCPLLQLTN